jgi:uncharacterized protein YllA (UPF0747 family)
LRLRDVPGYSDLFIDLAEYSEKARRYFPFKPSVEIVVQQAGERAHSQSQKRFAALLVNRGDELGLSPAEIETARSLQDPGARAVVASIGPSLLGGPLRQLLKCLTAVKLADRLVESGLQAVPVIWVTSERTGDFPPDSILWLDPELNLRELSYGEDLFRRLESYDPHISKDLEQAYESNPNPSAACANLVRILFRGWRMLVLDSSRTAVGGWNDGAAEGDRKRNLEVEGYTLARAVEAEFTAQERVLPLAARVVDWDDVYVAAACCADPVWPQACGTILSSRERLLLQKYNFSLPDLFQGRDRVYSRLRLEDKYSGVVGRLEELEERLNSGIPRAIELYRDEKAFVSAALSSMEKAQYQVRKMRERLKESVESRKNAGGRHIERLCNSLAPHQRTQESELAGMYFIMRFGRQILNVLLERMNLQLFEHQIFHAE